MSPKDDFGPNAGSGAAVDKKTSIRLQPSHKTAIVILLIAVLWMVSGVFKDDETAALEETATATTEVPGEGTATATKAEDEPVRVRVTTVHSEEHTRKIAILGRIEADKAVNVRAEVPGRVSEIVAQKGMPVTAGDVLVKLDPENLPALLAEARARQKQREIAYESAQKLSKGGYSSKLSVAQSKADLEAARAQVSGMQRDLANATITAPITGVVDSLPLEAGDFIDKAGAIAARVINLTTMVAVGEIAERDISAIELGGAATVRLPDDRVLSGVVSYIAHSSNALTRTFRVEVTVAVPDQSVPEGMTAELRLPMERVVAHHITPALLTLNDSGAVGVKSVNADNTVEFHAVEMVSDSEDGIWLIGLPDEVRIITVGQEFVIEGEVVEPVEGALSTMNSNGQDVNASEEGN